MSTSSQRKKNRWLLDEKTKWTSINPRHKKELIEKPKISNMFSLRSQMSDSFEPVG